jgi:ferredoxin
MRAPKAGDSISQAFVDFLKLLYTPEEAELVQHLKMGVKLRPAAEVATDAGAAEAEVNAALETLAKKGLLIGIGDHYAIPFIPLLVNNHHFTEEIGPDDLEAAKLYLKFFIEEGYYKYYESSKKGTQIMRVIPVGESVRDEQKILNTEEAHHIIDAVENISLVPCPCRTRTEKLGIRECRDRFPVANCIMTDMSAAFFQNLGIGKKVTAEEAKQYFSEMQELGLVGTTDNHEDSGHTVICLCCNDCCSQLRGRTRWDNPDAVAPSNFVARSNEDCVMCGECVDRCFFGAISLDDDQGCALVDEAKCMGCGVCTFSCPEEALRLERLEREQPFANSRELIKRVAVENREG